jgi:hypothetical protein
MNSDPELLTLLGCTWHNDNTLEKKLRNFKPRGPSVVLYREDLEEIIHILRDCCDTAQISDDDFTYESLEELESQKGKRPVSIILSSRVPPVNLEIDSKIVELKAVGIEGARNAFLRIKDILDRRRNKVTTRLLNPALHFIITLVGLASMFLFFPTQWPGTVAIGLVLMTVGMCSFLLAIETQGGRFSRISLKRRHEEESFWLRNKDKILPALIVALASSALTALVTYLFGGFSSIKWGPG